MPAWPSTLPDSPLQDSYQEQPGANTIRTNMDTGPAKHRKRASSAPIAYEAQYLLENSLVETLPSFYDSDTEEGALTFDWPKPRDPSTTLTARFVSQPIVSSQGGLFLVRCQMESLP